MKKRILTSIAALLAVVGMQAQGIRLSNGDVLNYNDVDSIVVRGKGVTMDQFVTNVMKQNASISIFNEALEKTGLMDEMQVMEDYSWNYNDPKYDYLHGKNIYSGAQNDWCDIPQSKRQKFTIFAVSDSLLKAKYGITSVAQLEAYAQKAVGGKDALRHLMAYHCLPFAAASYDKYVIITSIRSNMTDRCVNPTAWYATMDDGHLLKMSKLLSPKDIAENGGEKDHIYLNRGDMEHYMGTGVEVFPEAIEGVNGLCFLTDGLLAYGQETQQNVFNTEMRMNLIELCPEIYNNNLRNYEPWRNEPCNKPGAAAANYILPNGYLKNFKVNEDANLLYQGARSWYWCYQGDEFNLASDVNRYDLEITLPALPEGEYQLRLGFCAMGTRPIVEVSIDGQVTRILDQRASDNSVFASKIGWYPMDNLNSMDEASRNAILANMHANGWYHGPDDVFTTPMGKTDGTSALNAIGSGNYWSNQSSTIRAVLGTLKSDGKGGHTLRLKGIYAQGTALIQADYLEFVPVGLVDVPYAGEITTSDSERPVGELSLEQSVFYPAMLRAENDLNCYYRTVRNDDWVSYGGEGFLAYMNSWSNMHSLVMPTDNALKHYYDPVSYKRTKNWDISTAVSYEFYVNAQGRIAANAYLVNWESLDAKGRGTVTDERYPYTPTAESNNSRGEVFNKMKDIIESGWAETIFKPGQKFYKAKNGAPLIVDWDGDKVRGLAGSFQYERGYYVPVTETYDYSKEGNGKTYIIDEEPLQSTTVSPFAAIKENAQFSAFASLLEGSNLVRSDDGAWHVTMDMALTSLDKNDYTIYVPTNASVKELNASHLLPSGNDLEYVSRAIEGIEESIDEHRNYYYGLDENSDEARVALAYIDLLQLNKEYLERELGVMNNVIGKFLAAHIQFGSVYVDGAAQQGKQYSSMDAKLKVDYTPGGQIKVTDASGKQHTVSKDVNNILTRQYFFNARSLNDTSCTEIYSSSFAVIHQIDTPILPTGGLYNPENYEKVMEAARFGVK